MSNDGYYEAVFNKKGELLSVNNDPTNMGTYNYSGAYEGDAIKKYLHLSVDVVPWYIEGTSEEDPTEIQDRTPYYNEIKKILRKGMYSPVLPVTVMPYY